MRILLVASLLFAGATLAGEADGRRVLLHPHETEQPFTRELYGVRIPAGVTHVTVRARHKPKGYDGEVQRVALP